LGRAGVFFFFLLLLLLKLINNNYNYQVRGRFIVLDGCASRRGGGGV